jgi:ribosome maturation factor RimP
MKSGRKFTLPFIVTTVKDKGGLCLKKTNVAGEVEALLRPVVEGLGYALWDVVYRKVGADWTLTITIDSEEGISIDDCERVHRTIDPILDEADPIEDSYQLEVSSPGIEREIRTDVHIAACMGEEIDVRLFAPHEGKRAYTGILAGHADGSLTLQTAEGEVVLPRAAISHMNTTYHE